MVSALWFIIATRIVPFLVYCIHTHDLRQGEERQENYTVTDVNMKTGFFKQILYSA